MNLSNNTKPELRLDWCSYKAAKYACEHWHYSGCVLAANNLYIGVWEHGRFVGAVVFSRGANKNIGKPYGLGQGQVCELIRIALGTHSAPVSRILKVAILFLKKRCPNIILIVSYADPQQSHHGGIYQAGNWIYTGQGPGGKAFEFRGQLYHQREVSSTGYRREFGKVATCPKKQNCRVIDLPGKHKYLYPLTPEMRAKIEPLAKPYPKRASNKGNHPDQGQGGGAVPT